MRCPRVEYNPFWDAPKRVNLAAAAGRIAFLRRERRLLLDDSHNGIRCVAVLGQRNEAIDAVEEYCRYLGAALEKHAFSLEDNPRGVGNEGVVSRFARASPKGRQRTKYLGPFAVHGTGLVAARILAACSRNYQIS